MGSAFSSHTCISAFDGDNGVHASDQENSSNDCEVAAINEKLGKGGGEGKVIIAKAGFDSKGCLSIAVFPSVTCA